MDIGRLRLFAIVVQHGSISRASIAMGSAASAVSRQISNLERECGGRLFYRTGRGVALTELGTRIFTRIREPLAALDQLATEVTARTGQLSGAVRVGVLSSLTRPLANRVFRETRAKHPEIRLSFIQGSSGQLEELLTSGQIDMAVLARNSKKESPNEQLLAVLDTYLVGPRGDALTRAPTIKFTQLDGLPLILQGPNNGLRVAMDVVARKKGVNLKVAMETDSMPIMKDIVTTGGGHMVSTGHAIEHEVQSGTLQAARIINPVIPRYVTLCMSTPTSLASRELARIIRRIGEWDQIDLRPRNRRGT